MSSKQASLEKVKQTLVKLKQSIDDAEERVIEANQQKGKADSRLKKAEEEIESYRRRIQLLQADLVKTKKTLEEKQEKLAHVETRSLNDDEKRREYEEIEVERDDQLIAIEEEALIAKQQAAESTHVLMETQRKLQVVEGDLKKVIQRLDAAENKEIVHLDTIEQNGQELRTLEDRGNDAAEREMEAEELLGFLEEQLKEMVVRAESAERAVVRNENIVASVRNDLDNMQKKHADVDKQIHSIMVYATYSSDLDSFAEDSEPEPEDDCHVHAMDSLLFD